MSEKIQSQVRYVVDKRKFRKPHTAAAAIVRAKNQFVKTGESIPGVKIIGFWRNPDRRNPGPWKNTEQPGQSLKDFWDTLYQVRGVLKGTADRKDDLPEINAPGRSGALKTYHSRVRSIRDKFGISYANARKVYRRIKEKGVEL